MKNPVVDSTYLESGRLSNSPRALIDWPKGMSGNPVIYPLGGSLEETQKIRRLLEVLSRNVKADTE